MSLSHPYAYVFLSVALVLLSAAPLASVRRSVMGVLNAVFLLLVFEWRVAPVVLLAAFLVWHWVTLRGVIASGSAAGRRVWFYAWLVVSLAGFLVVKKYWWVTDPLVPRQWLSCDISTVGLSFVLFRQLGLSVEARDEQLTEICVGEYLGYTLAFWTFLAGPLQRFEAFRAEWSAWPTAAVSGRETLDALLRMMIGFTKMFLIAPMAGAYATLAMLPQTPSVLRVVIFLVACPAFVYVNFAGYCDIMIGVARATGFTLPENFNHPYVARNLNEFWQRWHITLSSMLRDYLYFPMQTSLARRMPILPAMALATLMSFFLMGAWHGNLFRFVVFGLLHGFGVVAVNLYTEAIRRRLGKAGIARYRQSAAWRAVGIAVCQTYVIFTFLAFNYDWPEIVEAWRRIHAVGGVW